MNPEFHCKGFDKMPRKTQEALAEMVSCLAKQVQRIPKGFKLVPEGETVLCGDYWRRPTDDVWIETGSAHWGTTVQHPIEYARKAASPVSQEKGL